MDNKKTIILVSLIMLGIVFLGVGYFAGVTLEKQKNAPELEKIERATKILRAVNSRVIPSPVAFGEITNISGRVLTLAYAGESLDILIKENAQIYFLPQVTAGTQDTVKERNIDFSEIKVGDWSNITLEISPDGQVEGLSVITFSPFIKTD